jgi:hypothetical protein
MLVYKVVKQLDGKFVSLYHDYFSNYSLTYELGKKTFPKVGKIFVYEKNDELCEYVHRLSEKVYLLECECFSVEIINSVLILGHINKQIYDFWYVNYFDKSNPFFSKTVPMDAKVTESLTPIRIVPRDEVPYNV